MDEPILRRTLKFRSKIDGGIALHEIKEYNADIVLVRVFNRYSWNEKLNRKETEERFLTGDYYYTKN